jgi:hypothetical protein
VQPLELETEVPAPPTDGLDEFDLEYFSEEKAAPVVDVGPEVAFAEEFPEEDVVDLEADMETLLDGQRGAEDAGAVEDEWPVQAMSFDDAAPPEESSAHEPPPWAVELMEELQRLRTENSVLRDALRGITTLLDRQIGVLQDGRDELDRHVGGVPGESEP